MSPLPPAGGDVVLLSDGEVLLCFDDMPEVNRYLEDNCVFETTGIHPGNADHENHWNYMEDIINLIELMLKLPV